MEAPDKPGEIQSSESFKLVKANWHDLSELRKLEQVCFGEDAWPLWDVIAVLTLPKVVRIKAVVNEKMAGFIAGDPRPAEREGWIATLGVLPGYRRRGIAEALLEACEAQLPMPVLKLTVRTDNGPAIALYKKMGYQMIDLWRNYYTSGNDALVLEKRR
jgi:ribosomal protein S18 acetylase RimI-like enzyme